MFAIARQEERHIVGKPNALHLRLTTKDGNFRFQIRRFDVGNQSPFETRVEPFLNFGYLARRTIGGQDDLLLPVIERVEGVKKLFLGALFTGNELDIVN